MPKSSTTVATTILNNPKKDDETMVWKVKRRPDGTRYIVRRPAKSRVIKERNARLNVERLRNELTTTEEDTISEIKTGRYWTREERKKHIEKARERRHQQQQQFFQQQNKSRIVHENLNIAALCIRDIETKLSQDPCEQEEIKQQKYLDFIRQHQKPVHQQQHYQLQFNSAESHNKQFLSLHNLENPTKPSSSTLPNTSEEITIIKSNVDQLDVINTIIFTPSEHNQISKTLQSVTTT